MERRTNGRASACSWSSLQNPLRAAERARGVVSNERLGRSNNQGWCYPAVTLVSGMQLFLFEHIFKISDHVLYWTTKIVMFAHMKISSSLQACSVSLGSQHLRWTQRWLENESKPGVVAHAFNSSTWETEAVRGWPVLRSELQNSQGYTKTVSNQNRNQNKTKQKTPQYIAPLSTLTVPLAFSSPWTSATCIQLG